MDELGKSIPLSEGLVDAEQGGQSKNNNEFCLNCGTKLLDTFCHHCGQKDLPRRQSMRELIENFIGSFYSFESKFFKTFRYLLFKPGFLPEEYTKGKRESYYHPARAYVFISFVFFLLFFSLPDDEEESKPMTAQQEQELNKNLEKLDSLKVDSIVNKWVPENAKVTGLGDSIKKEIKKEKEGKRKLNTGFSLTPTEYKTVAQYDAAQQLLPEEKRDGWFMRKINTRTIELNNKYKGDDGMKKFGKDFTDSFKSNFSTVLFYLLPIFALLFKLLYIRRDFYYSEHLVFSIYYYNFFYLAGSIYMLIDLIPWMGWLTVLIVLWIIAYLFLAMKRIYKQSWRKTFAKYFIFVFLFMIAISVAISISALMIIMSI